MTEAKELELQTTSQGVRAPLHLLSVKEGFNVREDTTPDEELLASIKANGVLRPLHIRPREDKTGHYYIIDGECRYNAALALGLDDVPVIPETGLSEADALAMSLVANDGSRKLTQKEEAVAFQRLRSFDITTAEIARIMGRHKRTVEETLRALESGDEELAKAVVSDDPEEKVPPRAAARVASLPEKKRKEVLEKIKGKNAREGVKVIREVEKKEGIVRRGRKASDYPWSKHAKAYAEILEKAAKEVIATGKGVRRAEAHLEIIEVLKGNMEPGELYVSIMKGQEEEAPAPKAAKKTGRKKKTKESERPSTPDKTTRIRVKRSKKAAA